MILTHPNLEVAVAFTADPNTAGALTPTWTVITNRVLSIDCSRSNRTDELSRYQAGSATLTLRNADGAFNPVNTSGPYYGSLLPYRMIRIRAVGAFGTFPIWQGFVERWPQQWTDPILGYSKIQCVDAFTLLALIGLDSAYGATVLTDAPTVFYPMDEQSGSSTAGNASSNLYPPAQIIHTNSFNNITPGAYAFGQPLALLGSKNQTGLQFTGTNNVTAGLTEDGYALVLPRVNLSWSGWTIEFWCQIPASPKQAADVFVCHGGAPPIIFMQAHTDGAAHNVGMTTPDGVTVTFTFPFPIADGNLHHVALTYSATSLILWIDGVAGGSGTATSSTFTGSTSMLCTLGSAAVNAQTFPGVPAYDGAPLIGTLGYFAVYPSALSQTRLAAHYEAGRTAFSGQHPGDRAKLLLSLGAWNDIASQPIQTGLSTMGPASGLSATSLLDKLQEVADAEIGTLTVTADGKIKLLGRDYRLLQTAPAIIFGSNVAGGEIPYLIDSLTFDFDPTLIGNDFQVSRTNGVTAESADAASIGRYFPQTRQLTMNVDTDDQVRYAADWLLQREKDPALRVEAFTIDAGAVNGNAVTGFWAALLGMDLHLRAQINHRPLGQPAITMDGFIEQIDHHIAAGGNGSPFTWQVTTQLSPVLGNYLIWDDPVYGVMDTTNRVAF
jgi:hypothetical protein